MTRARKKRRLLFSALSVGRRFSSPVETTGDPGGTRPINCRSLTRWLITYTEIMHICFEINGIPSDRGIVFSEHQILRMTTPLFKTRIEPEDHLKLFKVSPISVSFTVSQFHRKFQDFNQYFQRLFLPFFFRFWLFSSRFWSPYLSTSKRRPFRECRRMPKKVTSKPSHWRRLTGFPKNNVDIKMMAGVLALAITLVPTGERCLMVI